MRKKQVKPIKNDKKYRRYSAETMIQAYEAVKTKGISVPRAALQFRVPVQTLRDRIKGNIDPHNLHLGSETVFTHEEELTLIDHIEAMSELGYGHSNVQLQYMAGDLAHALGKRSSNKALSNNWLYSFLNRWSDRIASLKPRSLESNRAKSSSPEIIEKYYSNLKAVLEKYELQDRPQFIYNLDETGIQPEHRPPNVIASINSKPQAITSPRSTTTTVIACVNAVGNSIPPYFVFKGKRFNPDLMNGATPGAKGVMSDSGWSNSIIFRTYLEDHFLPHVRRGNDDEQPILLLYDGHSSHVSPQLIEWANSNNLILFVLPAHTSHLLQPLDVSVFGPFKKYYYNECATYMKSNIGQTITRYEMCEMACKAYLKAMTPNNIISGFKKTGIYPCSNEAINKEKLFPSECFRDEEPLKKVQAIKSSKEAIMAYLQEKMDKKTSLTCQCSVKKSEAKEPSNPKPKPGGQAITGAPYMTAFADHEIEKENIKPSKSVEKGKLQKIPKCKSKKISKGSQVLTNTKKSSPNCKRAIYDPVPSTSGLNIINDKTENVLTSDSEMDTDVEYDESEVCCVCKRFSPPNLNDRPYLKIVNWGHCDECGHWVHLTFCSKQTVLRRNDSFLCCHCQ